MTTIPEGDKPPADWPFVLSAVAERLGTLVERPTYARAVALVVGFDMAQPESIHDSMQERVARRLHTGSHGWPWVLMAEAVGGDLSSPPDLDELSPEQDAVAIAHLVKELRSLLGI